MTAQKEEESVVMMLRLTPYALYAREWIGVRQVLRTNSTDPTRKLKIFSFSICPYLSRAAIHEARPAHVQNK